MNRKAFVLASITIVLWASSFAGVRVSLLGGYSPTHLVLVRFLVASSIFVLYGLLKDVNFKIPRREDVFRILILGWVGISVYHLGLTFGIETVPAGTAALIVGSAPIFTAIIAVIFLKERLDLFSWIGLGVGFVGIALITIGSAGPSFSLSKGVFFIIIGTIGTSVFFVFQKPLFEHYHPIELTAYFTWAGTLPFLLFMPGLFTTLQQTTIEANIAAIFVGIFPAGIAYATWAVALSLSEGSTSSVTSMMYMEPAVAIIIAWVWLKEWPSTISLIGGTIAISSVLIVNIIGRNREQTGIS